MPTANQRLDQIGIDAICSRIEAGETYSEIAKSLKIDYATMHRWINNDEDRHHASARARTASAEAWLDRGLATIATALRRDGGIDASAARAYAQECARRAAIRNPVYRDKVDATVEAGSNLLGVLAGLSARK